MKLTITFNNYEELLEKIEYFKECVHDRRIQHCEKATELGAKCGLLDPMGIWVELGEVTDTKKLHEVIEETNSKYNELLKSKQIIFIDEEE